MAEGFCFSCYPHFIFAVAVPIAIDQPIHRHPLHETRGGVVFFQVPTPPHWVRLFRCEWQRPATKGEGEAIAGDWGALVGP
jgi:hypothetical protein